LETLYFNNPKSLYLGNQITHNGLSNFFSLSQKERFQQSRSLPETWEDIRIFGNEFESNEIYENMETLYLIGCTLLVDSSLSLIRCNMKSLKKLVLYNVTFEYGEESTPFKDSSTSFEDPSISVFSQLLNEGFENLKILEISNCSWLTTVGLQQWCDQFQNERICNSQILPNLQSIRIRVKSDNQKSIYTDIIKTLDLYCNATIRFDEG
jgi:hypothetical protein